MPVYSHSRLSTFETCPLKYRFKYIDRIEAEEGESIEAFLGSRVHETLEKLYKCARYSKTLELHEVIKFFGEQWDREWNDGVVIRKKDLTPRDYRETGIKCLKSYYLRHHPFEQATTIGIEERLSFPLSKDGGYMVQGFIDRLDRAGDGVYCIHDYKTSGNLPLQTNLDTDRQLALYEIGVRERFTDAKSVELRWHYLLFDTELRSSRTREELEKLKVETMALIDTIEAENDFPYRESALCEWCEFQEHCPARKHLVAVEGLKPEEFLSEDGVSLVNRYASLWQKSKEIEAELEATKEALKEYAKKEGVETVKGSGHTVKVVYREKFKFPDTKDPLRAELEGVIKASGRWDEVSQLDTRALGKVLHGNSWDKTLLEKVGSYTWLDESATVYAPRVLKEEK